MSKIITPKRNIVSPAIISSVEDTNLPIIKTDSIASEKILPKEKFSLDSLKYTLTENTSPEMIKHVKIYDETQLDKMSENVKSLVKSFNKNGYFNTTEEVLKFLKISELILMIISTNKKTNPKIHLNILLIIKLKKLTVKLKKNKIDKSLFELIEHINTYIKYTNDWLIRNYDNNGGKSYYDILIENECEIY